MINIIIPLHNIAHTVAIIRPSSRKPVTVRCQINRYLIMSISLSISREYCNFNYYIIVPNYLAINIVRFCYPE